MVNVLLVSLAGTNPRANGSVQQMQLGRRACWHVFHADGHWKCRTSLETSTTESRGVRLP